VASSVSAVGTPLATESITAVISARRVDARTGHGWALRRAEAATVMWAWCADYQLADGYATVLATIATGTRRGTVLQLITKTDASRRRLILPAFVVDAIGRAQAIGREGGAHDLLFPNLSGGVRQPGAIREELAKLLAGTEWAWVHTHVMRKTVATLLARELDSEAAAEQLGHADDETTKRSYIEKMHATPDVRHVLDRLAG